ncbi:hypothetical protein [Treponema denticola]|uniref:hypothetical protein n=1 Tax=Treponema denticola TaxID=158 RepID=UPI0020A40E2C|nr:hypothetical protein [Treponema denticola]
MPRTAIAREQKQFIKIAFAVHLSAAISAERYRSDSGTLKSAVLTLVYFYIIMKLDGLFKADETFMNETLRDFLNLKEEGTMNYSLDELMDPNSGWSEMSSIESQYHQTNAEKPNLNAKFIHQDGREVVINSKEMVVLDYPDKGTFNYVNGSIINPLTWRGHSLYDIKPYEKLITHNVLITSNKSYWFGYNTSRWIKNK